MSEGLAMKHDVRRLRIAAVAIVLFPLIPLHAALAKVDLKGRVLTSGGLPIGHATVYIYTAGPRTGTSVYCPSCYPDCGKTRAADRDGRFVVPALNDSLTFQVLVVAPGFEPTFAKKVDPAAGPLDVRLDGRDPRRLVPERAISGRIVDEEGRPVVGATVEPEGYHYDGGARFGIYEGTDPVAITDEIGSFDLMTAQPTGAWDLRVRARNLAPAVLHEVPVGGSPLAITLRPGALVTGRVLRDGRPLPGVVLGLGQVINIGGFMAYGREQVATDAEGRFTFVNVTPGEDYWLYGTLESFRAHGVASSQRLTVADRDTVKAVPPIVVTPGYHIAGRVRLRDGKAVPPGTHLTIARDPVVDAAILQLDAEARFATGGLPQETVNLFVRVPGYRLSRETPGYQRDFVTVAVVGDRDDIEIVLEPE